MLTRIPNRCLEPAARPMVMGILNVTPDSFSDGGRHLDPQVAADRAMQMIEEGAEVIDVGPESTRPGADPVTAEEQIGRAVPVIEEIRRRHASIALSIDTTAAAVASAALDAGADMVNDISALADDPAMAELIAARGCWVVLMHRRGTPKTMQAGGGPEYADVVGEVAAFLGERAALAEARGIRRDRIVVDPGIGFGKRAEHNLALLRASDKIAALGHPLLVGASRKRFIGTTLAEVQPAGVDRPNHRLLGSLACVAAAVLGGAAMIRVHDVRQSVGVARMAAAIAGAGE